MLFFAITIDKKPSYLQHTLISPIPCFKGCFYPCVFKYDILKIAKTKRERRFIKFSSVEYKGRIYMTPQVSVYSLIATLFCSLVRLIRLGRIVILLSLMYMLAGVFF